MAVLLLGGQVIDYKIGAGWMGEEIIVPPSSLLYFNLYPCSHIRFPHLLMIVMELCTGLRSSRGEDWYNINPLPRIIKQRDWALNECCCIDEYMFNMSLTHMGMAVLLLGDTSLPRDRK